MFRTKWILAAATVALIGASGLEAEAQCGGQRKGLFARLRERRSGGGQEAAQGCSDCGSPAQAPSVGAAPGTPVYVVEGGQLRQVGVIPATGEILIQQPKVLPKAGP